MSSSVELSGTVEHGKESSAVMPTSTLGHSDPDTRKALLDQPPVILEKPSTIPQSVANLVKNIVGAGVLALPNGFAALSDDKTVLITAFAMLLIMGCLSGYCFSLLGVSCYKTNTTSFGTAWSVAISPRTAWIPKTICTFKAFIGCLAYSMITADSWSRIFETLGLPEQICSRTAALWLMTVATILPLCMLRSLKALAPFSLLGTIGMLYTTVFMGIRWLDGSYTEGGQFFDDIDDEFKPKFNSGSGNPASAFVLMSMASSAYIAHYNAPKYYTDLKDRSPARFQTLTGIAFIIACTFFILAGSFGFLTFGSGSNGLILNNYSLNDTLATIARVCIGCSIVLTYPLACIGFRDGMIEIVIGRPQSQQQKDLWTVGLLAMTTFVANVITDLGFIMSFSGAFFGAWVAYIIPAMIALGTQQRGYMESSTASRGVNRAIIVVGLILCVLGSVVSVLHTFTDMLDPASDADIAEIAN